MFPKGFHVRKTIAFALVLTLLLPIAAFWGWLVLSPKPPLLDGVPFSPLVLDRDGYLLGWAFPKMKNTVSVSG